MPKGFLPARRSAGRSWCSPRPRRTSRSRRWPNMQRQVAEIVKRESATSRARCRSVGAGGPSASLNVGRIFVALKPREHTSQRRRGRAAAARPAVARQRHQGVRAEHPGDPHRRPGHARARISTRCRAPTRPSCTSGRRGSRRSCSRCPALVDVTSDLQIIQAAGHRRDRPQQGVGARRFGAGDREHAVRRLRPAPGVDDLRADQPVLGRDGAASRATRPTRRYCRCSTCARRAGRWCR